MHDISFNRILSVRGNRVNPVLDMTSLLKYIIVIICLSAYFYVYIIKVWIFIYVYDERTKLVD